MMISPSQALSPEDASRIDALYAKLKDLCGRNIGYPCNQDFDYSDLYPFLEVAANNVGDPFAGSQFRQNTHEMEREVVREMGRFAGAPEEDALWGYVTNGGTEGNMYGLYLAREIFPDGMAYFSEDSHYSVAKILRLQHTRNIMIRSQPDGEMDYEDLRESIRIHRDVPPIIFANIGTTMKGAVDNIATIKEILQELAIHRYYLHCDAALSGMILPFVDRPQPWSFAAGVDSIAVSGHKLLGNPLPCGVVLAKREHVDRVARSVEYVGVLDTTISGSRSAITPLFLWYRLKQLGQEGMRDLVQSCLGRARYAVEALGQRGVDAWRHRNSITVVMPRPGEDVIHRWLLAPEGDIVHIITSAHVTQTTIDAFIRDYCRNRQGTKSESDNRAPVTIHQE